MFTKKFKFIILIILFGLNVSCTNGSMANNYSGNKIFSIPFEDGSGSVIISTMENNKVDLLINRPVKTKSVYRIGLLNMAGDSIVLFSQDNTLIRGGVIKNEADFLAEQDELYLWSVQPSRMFNNPLKVYFISKTEETKILSEEIIIK